MKCTARKTLHVRCILRITQASLGNLSALVEAHLSFNQLRSPLPAGLGGLKRLKVLHTRDNHARP